MSVPASSFKFLAACEDTCTDEKWETGFDADISATYNGAISIPGVCGAIAAASKFTGVKGTEMGAGRGRAGATLALTCTALAAYSVYKIIHETKEKVENVLNTRSKAFIAHYLNLGATAICKGSK
ncbi:hypothetical protein [Marinagarivorans algicola]|uniref:hypothetical protein n=1 Tax=Marinagarivorans algicola TaxID=1513270 RepID=UPI00373527F6